MDKKSWRYRSAEGGETIKDIVLSEPAKDINGWLDKCKAEGLDSEESDLFIKCADHFNKISFESVTPEEFSNQWNKYCLRTDKPIGGKFVNRRKN